MLCATDILIVIPVPSAGPSTFNVGALTITSQLPASGRHADGSGSEPVDPSTRHHSQLTASRRSTEDSGLELMRHMGDASPDTNAPALMAREAVLRTNSRDPLRCVSGHGRFNSRDS